MIRRAQLSPLLASISDVSIHFLCSCCHEYLVLPKDLSTDSHRGYHRCTSDIGLKQRKQVKNSFQNVISANKQGGFQCQCQVCRLCFVKELFVYIWKRSSYTHIYICVCEELFFENIIYELVYYHFKLYFWIGAYCVLEKSSSSAVCSMVDLYRSC